MKEHECSDAGYQNVFCCVERDNKNKKQMILAERNYMNQIQNMLNLVYWKWRRRDFVYKITVWTKCYSARALGSVIFIKLNCFLSRMLPDDWTEHS